MITVAEAQQQILQSIEREPAKEQLPLSEALGRVLAEDVCSPVDVPPWDNSAMDGYAVNTSTLNQRETLPVSQVIAAGQNPAPLAPDTTARIFTGAPIPSGADAVEMQENVEASGDEVRFTQAVRQGCHIRRRGEDIKQGELILQQGTLLKAQHLGLLASVGRGEVIVSKPLTVAVLSTGDELVEPGDTLQPGQIYNSNRYTLMALLKELGCTVVDTGMVEDDFESTRQCLINAAQQADVVISSGGVSVGDEDHVKSAVESIGQLDLWKIAVKPGKPLAFGTLVHQQSRAVFFGLPGNPVSSFVTFLLFVKPYLLKRLGTKSCLPEAVSVRSDFDWPAPGKSLNTREEYLRVSLDRKTMCVSLYDNQSSGVLSSVVWADGLVKVAPQQQVKSGEPVEFYSF